ncbi:MAG: hypothetical protein ISR59_12375 [Anaerolineales bacterium]|uniref:Uncharacterized protein n=1 Tax=Candidatus Desulfolinea nitratireducens TaxID=2841698 RepID=A0A8J6NHN2_9CHLR|nr:hypothetical protein [Candidatus Desulfolinea nitratireducens]MBL6961894.1 hypothetical protein [Anaerolineales bacterium]
MDALNKLSRSLGLHPLVGFGMVAVDMMLFGAEAATFELIWPISVAVGAALTIPSILIQRHSFKDSWGASIGKGMLVGVLTAIPTPLPALVPLLGGTLGTIQMLGSGKEKKALPPIEGEIVEDENTPLIEGKFEKET